MQNLIPMRSIKKLPEAVHSSIRSGTILYDLTRVVEELVYNSLDAGANKVSIAVGVGTCYAKVVDNGYGVSRDGLELLGEKYATSKYDPLDDTRSIPLSFGYRGEALSSITDVSLVEIVTKAHGRPNGYRKVLKGHKCLYLGIDDDRQDVGTTVTVRDLFYNQPVRRKHMLSNPKKVLHVVKECVLRIALLHPNVSFKVVDIESEEELLHTCPFPSSLPLLAKVFGVEASSSLEELNVAGGEFKLSGYISGTPDGFSWKAFQYVYINSRFICKGQIHKMLNNLAAGFNISTQSERQSKSQICPTFILNLNCPKSCYDLTFEPAKTSVEFKDWDSVLTFIGDAVGCLWSGGKSADLPVKCEIGKKRRRALNSMGSQGSPPQSKKVTEECNNFHVSRENKSPSHCRVVISHDLSPLPHNVFSHEDTDLLGLNRSNSQLNYTFSSGWNGEPPKADAGPNRLLTDHVKFNNSPELGDNSDVNEDVRKPFLQSCLLRRSLKPGERSLASDEGLDFEIEDHSKQNAFSADDRVVEEVNDINKILSPRNVWDNEQTDLLSFSKTTIQHDVQQQLNFLLGDSVNSSLNPELPYEEGLFLPDVVKPFQRSNSCLHSDSCTSSPMPSNYLTGIASKNIAHTIGEDLVANCLEYNGNVRYDYLAKKEREDWSYDIDKISIDPGKEECFFSSSKKLSSDGTGVASKNIAHTSDEDLVANCLEYNGNVRYDYLANKEREDWRYDINKISIDPGKEECFFSSSEKLSSDGTGIASKNIAHTIGEDLVANGLEYNGNVRYDFLVKKEREDWRYDIDKISIDPGKDECFFSSSEKISSDGTGIASKNIVHTVGEDLVANCLEYNRNVRYDYLANKEREDWRYDIDKISIDPGKEECFSSSKKLSSDGTGIASKNIAHTIGEDLVANCLEYNGNVRYDYLANKEREGWRYDIDKISIDLGKEECFFSSSKKLSSDVKDCAGFKENSSDFQEHDLYDPFSPMEINTGFQEHNLKDAFSLDSFNIFTDCINTWDEVGNTNCSTSRHHTSSIDFDWDSCTRVHPRDLSKTFDPDRRGRRSNSAPPFYRGRKKFLASSDSLTMTAGKVNLDTIHHRPGFPGSNNLKQIQHHSEVNGVKPSLQSNQYDQSTSLYCEESSFSDDIPDKRIMKSDNGKSSNKCHVNSFEEFIPKEIQDPLDSGEKWQKSHPHRTSGSRLLHVKNQDTILDIASGILHLAGDSLIPRSLDKNCLEGAKVLQQVDKKYIPIVASRTLALIDQHAADERIRLEDLRRKVLSGEMRRTNYLDCEQELIMPEIGFQLLHDYAEQIQNWGWICNSHTQGSTSFTRNLNIMHKQQAVATLLAVPCILGVNLSDVDLLEFLQQLADTDGSSTIPPSVLRVLNNKACRGAIMFGDALLPSECSLIVEELKQTSLCFQCAHGRPTTVSLVNLDALSEQIAKITSWSRGSCESWHGLHRHEISLERTSQRFSSATRYQSSSR